ncbi:MAG: HisA/HisF-related TIM barrel protein [Thermaerobacter sp.]|nr:HisA/HisF-related TIM barrel protein [Thermaerobacter sp.]
MSLEVWPALDLLDGQPVRLTQGRYADVTRYGHEPLALVTRRLGAFPPRMHVVDLGGARAGAFGAWDVVRALTAKGVRVEVGGGFRSLEAIAQALAEGAERVILGTRLLTDPGFAVDALARFGPQALVASIDVAHGLARISGWEAAGPKAQPAWRELYRLGYRLANVTDIRGDGTLKGLDESFWTAWANAPGDIGAGGGVSQSADLSRLLSWGISRVVVGKAWMEGRLSPKEVGVC